jgi:hypothetical protein
MDIFLERTVNISELLQLVPKWLRESSNLPKLGTYFKRLRDILTHVDPLPWRNK